MVGLIAVYCAARASVIKEFWRGLVPAMICIGAVAGFIVLADLGTGVLIAGVACLMLLAGGRGCGTSRCRCRLESWASSGRF